MNDIAAARLRAEFRSACNAGEIGSLARLKKLAAAARQCLIPADRERRAVAYALYQFLQSVTADKEERPVSLSEMNAFTSQASGPISNAIEFIAEGQSTDRAVDVIAEIAELHSRILPA